MILLSDGRDLGQTGKLMRAMRKRRGLTQAQLAERLGYTNLLVGEITVSGWERGRNERGVPLHRLLEVADVLDMDLIVDFRERGQ